MRKSNFALRLQPSLLEELRTIAASEGVALNQLINVAIAESFPRCVPKTTSGNAPGMPIVPKPCEFWKKREAAIPRSPVMSFLLKQREFARKSEPASKPEN